MSRKRRRIILDGLRDEGTPQESIAEIETKQIDNYTLEVETDEDVVLRVTVVDVED